MKKQKLFFFTLFTCITIFIILSAIPENHICLAQGGIWPQYTQNVLFDPILQYIQAASFPGSIMVSGCWGYPWFSVPWDYSYPTSTWNTKKYYMYYPPMGWFDEYLYPFLHIYNVADPLRDFPNFLALLDNPATWIDMPVDMLLRCSDPICFYLSGGIHFFSGAVTSPYAMLEGNNPSIDLMLLKYLSLMGLFDYNVPQRLAFLPGL